MDDLVCSIDAEDARILIEHYQFQMSCNTHRPESWEYEFARDRFKYWTEVKERTFAG